MLSRLALLVAAVKVVWLGGLLVMSRSHARPLVDLVRALNKRAINPLMLLLAGRPFWYAAVVRHVGQRSGRPYTNPVVAEAVRGGFLIPLFYGREVDWLRNVLAAGRFTIVKGGSEHAVGEPEIVGRELALPLLPPIRRLAFRLFGIREFLRVRRLDRENHR